MAKEENFLLNMEENEDAFPERTRPNLCPSLACTYRGRLTEEPPSAKG